MSEHTPHDRMPTLDAPTTADLIIVGGGLAAMAAAAVAADERPTARIVVLERRGHPGGRAETMAHGGGYQLNVGPHALYLGGAAAALARRFGLPLAGAPPVLDGGMGRIGDRLAAFPTSARTLATTTLVARRARPQLGRILASVRAGRHLPRPELTVADWLDGLTDHEDCRQLLASLVRLSTYAHAEELVSAEAAAAQLALSARHGVRYLDGGWQSMIDGFAAVAAAKGVRLLTHQTVRVVRPGAEGWEVGGDGGWWRAPTVVVAAGGPQQVAALLGATPPGWDALGPPVTASVLDVGSNRPPTYRFVHGVDQPLYLSTHSTAAGLAPAGASLVTVARYHRPDEVLSATAVRAQLAEHAALAGLPRTAETTETAQIAGDGAQPNGLRRYLHRLVVTHTMPLARLGGLSGRPGVAVPDRPGLFVAGDWVGAEGLLADASAASGAAAARAALDRLRQHRAGGASVDVGSATMVS